MNLILGHPVVAGVIALYVASAAVAALPEPGSGRPIKSLAYQWLFAFAHTLMNNVEAAMKAKYPDLALASKPTDSMLSSLGGPTK